MLQNHSWCWWALSVNPGEDNRGCAGWGQTLKFIPRVWFKTNTYEIQWRFNVESSPDVILIVTFNDFSEATVILPTRKYGFQAMKSTAKYASLWKGQPVSVRWLSQPSEWFLMKKDVDFLAKTQQLNVTELYLYLEATMKLMLDGCFNNARNFLKFVRARITNIKEKQKIKRFKASLPSPQLYFVKSPTVFHHGYLTDDFHKLYIQLNKTVSALLQENNYRVSDCLLN
ncbi:uncharacterized protein LOC106477095 isoform X2 [Limulus polyphemus]|uniref:Uncharacterized protein LOC106477095 isoform X2 n=1 Tax=Limulus polyphemus TaxID=6850 RepID=A0ABM1RYN8_LIMPO|nr:uncharacterized protein LOC106477095 isoform X2 [Limulus polyphemus]